MNYRRVRELRLDPFLIKVESLPAHTSLGRAVSSRAHFYRALNLKVGLSQGSQDFPKVLALLLITKSPQT
jgi:hypothetical protein